MLRLRCGKIAATIHTTRWCASVLSTHLIVLLESRIFLGIYSAGLTAAITAPSVLVALYVFNFQTRPPQGGKRVLRAAYEKDPGNPVPKRDFVVIARGRRPVVTLRLPEHARYRG
jgi:hypothetical protein